MQAIASIASAIAIPIVLAFFGYVVQRQLSSEGLKKDYVQIATNILKDNASIQDPELRKWAVDVLDKNADLPFSPAAKRALTGGFPTVRHEFVFLPPPVDCMMPPAPLKLHALVKSAIKPEYIQIEDVKQFLIALSKETEKAEENTARLKCLQDYVNVLKQFSEKINAGEYGLAPPRQRAPAQSGSGTTH